MPLSITSTAALLLLHSMVFIQFATATYSIVATDSLTKQVGGAGATCLTGSIYDGLYLSAPGKSVMHTQGWLLPRDSEIIATALDMMKEGTSCPNEIFEAMISLDTNETSFTEPYNITFQSVDIRQYAMANFENTASYSGSELKLAWEYFGYGTSEIADVGKIGLNNGRYNYHAIGNVVKNGTVNALKVGFEDEEPLFGTCDEAGKLMMAMYEVYTGNFGDERCLDLIATSAAGAYIHVDNADGTALLHIDVTYDGSDTEPVEVLILKFLEWRREHPCENNIGGEFGEASSSPAPSSPMPMTTAETAFPTTTTNAPTPTSANASLSLASNPSSAPSSPTPITTATPTAIVATTSPTTNAPTLTTANASSSLSASSRAHGVPQLFIILSIVAGVYAL